MAQADDDRTSADLSVRLAWPDDAAAIAAIQREHWQRVYGSAVDPQELEALDVAVMAERWTEIVRAPRDARMRVLVALERATVRGFALVHPCHDPDADQVRDAEFGEFVVAEPSQRQGHGSRLLHAGVDTVRADGFGRAVWWVNAADDALRAWLIAAGWEADGAHREFAAEGGAVKQVRLHTTLT